MFSFKNPKEELHDTTKFTIFASSSVSHIQSRMNDQDKISVHTYLYQHVPQLKSLHNSRKGQALGLKRMEIRIIEQNYTRKKSGVSV